VLLDIWSVLGGVGLAAVAFIVVILVCVVILGLLAAILPSYEDRETRVPAVDGGVSVDSSESSGEAPEAGVDDPEHRVEERVEPPVGEAEAPVDRAKQATAPDEAAPI
jgi:hypothetical protein